MDTLVLGSLPMGRWLTPRSDGLIGERSDLEPDGVHPSAEGVLKVATMLFEFFRNTPQPNLGSSPVT